MRGIEVTFVLILLVGLSWAFIHYQGMRRRVARAVHQEARPDPGGRISPELAQAGFDEAIRVGAVKGAQGVFDGVVVQAFGGYAWSPVGGMTIWTFAVRRAASGPHLRVSATAQGVLRKRGSIPLGLPAVDTRLDVSGDPEQARELFRRPAAAALVEAITRHGWRLVDGRLVRVGLSVHNLREIANAGAAAAKALGPPSMAQYSDS